MPNVISNTSPLLYLHRIGALEWLPRLFDEYWVPTAVVSELEEGRRCGFDIPDVRGLRWLRIVEPQHSVPVEWLTIDLGRGELAAMAIARENPGRIVLLDDALARQTAQKSGLQVWGTLRIMLEAKSNRITPTIGPWVQRLADAGLWFSEDLRKRILALAGESTD